MFKFFQGHGSLEIFTWTRYLISTYSIQFINKSVPQQMKDLNNIYLIIIIYLRRSSSFTYTLQDLTWIRDIVVEYLLSNRFIAWVVHHLHLFPAWVMVELMQLDLIHKILNDWRPRYLWSPLFSSVSSATRIRAIVFYIIEGYWKVLTLSIFPLCKFSF